MPAPKERVFLGLVICLAYVLIAAQLQNLYPFSTFPMYSSSVFTSGARLVAVDEAGVAHEITDFEAWSCPELGTVDRVMCPDGELTQPTGYLAKEAIDYIFAHPAPRAEHGAQPESPAVSLVVRTWRLDTPEGETRVLDCPVSACTAERR